jgi:CHAT domain-containing protein
VLARRLPGLAPSYSHLDGWAAKFLEAGASAFIGSLWSVVDGPARQFAVEVYQHLLGGVSLGEAVLLARKAAARRPGDPTWLAYSVYGDPGATVTSD